jgi:hypothetical protein
MDKQSAVEILRAVVIAVVLIAALGVFYRLTLARAYSILRSWAELNGFELLQSERCGFSGSFSPLTTSANHIVYFVRVRDREKRERSGWVRCGSWASFIFFSKRAEVMWKDSQ